MNTFGYYSISAMVLCTIHPRGLSGATWEPRLSLRSNFQLNLSLMYMYNISVRVHVHVAWMSRWFIFQCSVFTLFLK